MKKIVDDYKIITDIPSGDYKFGGNSIGLKGIVEFVPTSKASNQTILDIGFGIGDLARIVKSNPEISHWHIDGIDGFYDTCCNVELFKKGLYRNIWHGLAQEMPPDQLRRYDMICLFDVIEHLEVDAAKAFMAELLAALGENSRLIVSTPLWFWLQSQQHPGDLEEHRCCIPAQSLFMLDPVMYFINSKYLIGTFVYTRKSLERIAYFRPITDKKFDYEAGMRHLSSLSLGAHDRLYFK